MASVSTSPAPHQCSTCDLDSSIKKPKNLVVFIDGTSNKPGDKNTNVVKLFQKVISGSIKGSELEQDTYYLYGIGAYDINHLDWLGRTKKEMYSALEMAFARNVEKNIQSAYTWLANAYQEGARNHIYLFGFSRGAYQVRALASLIHEVGLVKEKNYMERAYNHYLAIDPYKPETRKVATQFKKDFCWQDVRIHFVGVWDTVSSLGLIKKDVHVTASASVTNACHFRHALALDERRVKFMPEYFLEMNAHHSEGNPRTAIGDVKEVWFAGSHSDVGGTDRPPDQMHVFLENENAKPHIAHAGHVSFLWMKREAAANGLVFMPEEFSWDPEDVEFGRTDSMSFKWGIVEVMPIRHQVSFSGTGIHRRRWHLSRPRPVIPGQQIHPSVGYGVYKPRASLRGGIDIPVTRTSDDLWATELPDEEVTTRLLSSLLVDHKTALESLEKVLFLLDSGNGQTQSIPRWQWSRADSQFDLANFALTIITDVISNFTVPDSEVVVSTARASLVTVLSFPEHPDIYKTLYTLRFSSMHQTLRQRFVGHDEVIRALMFALEWTSQSPRESLFPLVMDSLYHLMDDDQLRGAVVDQLINRLSVTLGVKAPNQLKASLKIIARLAQYGPGRCAKAKRRVCELAAKERGPVGSTAVEILVKLKVPLDRDIHFSNILGYLDSTLPRLDAEAGTGEAEVVAVHAASCESSGSTALQAPPPSVSPLSNSQSFTARDHRPPARHGCSAPDNIDDLPPEPLTNGSGELNEELVRQLVLTIKSRDVHQRIVATLTLLKLCKYSIIRQSFARHQVLAIFIQQLKKETTSLLAAYALRTCMKYDIWTPDDFRRAAPLIITMLDKGWFDDAVGRVQGCEIFRGLMTSADLREQVIGGGIIARLVKKCEVGNHHEVRMDLICLDIFGRENPSELASIVADSVSRLKNNNKKVQKKGVKVLAALAQTAAGEEVIKPYVIEIVNMLLPSSNNVPRSRFFGPAAALYDLSKNETLREQIKASPEFINLRHHIRRTTRRLD